MRGRGAGGPWMGTVLALASAVGLWAFLAPLAGGAVAGAAGATADRAAGAEAPLVFLLLVALSLAAIVGGLESRSLDPRAVAALGVLTGANAVLRLVPGPFGFSAAFFLPIVCGYTFGAGFGFLLGAFSLLVSAVVTNGLGPWVPFQMLAAGWIGLASAGLPDLERRPRLEIAVLALWGALAGLLFGAAMNLWFWPYLDLKTAGAPGPGFRPGAGLAANLATYGLYYLTTSLVWDVGRAVGNVLLLAAAGRPVLRLLRRFRRRFTFTLAEQPDAAGGGAEGDLPR